MGKLFVGIIIFLTLIFILIRVFAIYFTRIEEKEKEEYNEKVRLFCEKILYNEAVIALADTLCHDIKDWINISIEKAQKKKEDHSAKLEVLGSYIDDYEIHYINSNYKRGIYYSEYGIQEIEEPYKIYGLAITLGKLIEQKMKETLASEVKQFTINILSHNDFKALVELSWTIEKNGLIEL